MVAVDPCVTPNRLFHLNCTPHASTLQAGDGSSGDESESEVSDLPHFESDLFDWLDGMKYRSRIVRTHLRNSCLSQ